DPRIGAACPKIRFADDAVEVELTVPTHRPGRGDGRDLGVRCSGARVNGVDVWSRAQLVSGFWGDEPMPPAEAGGQWTGPVARLRLPVTAPPPRLELRLAATTSVTVAAVSGTRRTALTVATEPAWFTVASDAAPVA